MGLKIFTFCLVTLMTVLTAKSAHAATHQLFPDQKWEQACTNAGFVGNFSIRMRTGNAYEIKFAQTGAKFIVFGDGPGRYIMSISGSWSEQIEIDLNDGVFNFSSTRPPKRRVCYGQIEN